MSSHSGQLLRTTGNWKPGPAICKHADVGSQAFAVLIVWENPDTHLLSLLDVFFVLVLEVYWGSEQVFGDLTSPLCRHTLGPSYSGVSADTPNQPPRVSQEPDSV